MDRRKTKYAGPMAAESWECQRVKTKSDLHPTIWICDEIAFIPEAEECWNAVHAAGTPQMIGISSADLDGWQSSANPELRQRPHP